MAFFSSRTSWLIKHPGMQFELAERDRSCLPKEYKNVEGTCYFLDDYKHETVNDENATIDDHIDAAMKQITD